MQDALGDLDVRRVLIGFSPPRRLQAITRHLGWTGGVLADEDRQLYRRLGVGRAPWWRIYTPGTLGTYARDLLGRGGGTRLPDAGEDTRQLGADAICRDGRVRVLWRPRSPDDRPAVVEVAEQASIALRGRR